MVDLIPVGTINRPASENNAPKPTDNVQETARSKELADQQGPQPIERRRFKERRRNRRERRLSRAPGTPLTDRRKMPDRRKSRAALTDKGSSGKPVSRKGRIIDERV